MNNAKIKKMTMLANFIAIAIVLNLIEAQLDFIPVPGAKLGLANLVTLVVVYMFSYKEALIVTIVRIVVVGLLSGRLLSPTFYMSLSGGLLSVVIMVLLKNLNIFGIVLVSLLSSIAHQIGQIAAGVFVIGSSDVIYYLPIMLPVGIIAGVLIGIIAKRFIKIMEDKM